VEATYQHPVELAHVGVSLRVASPAAACGHELQLDYDGRRLFQSTITITVWFKCEMYTLRVDLAKLGTWLIAQKREMANYM
jgi:hypothetical protein